MEEELTQQEEQLDERTEESIDSVMTEEDKNQIDIVSTSIAGTSEQDSKSTQKEKSQNHDDKKSIIEALIFASEEPLTFNQLKEIIEGDESSSEKKDDQEKSLSDSGEESQAQNDVDQEASESPRAPKRKRRTKKSGFTQGVVKKLVDELNDEYFNTNRSFRIIQVAGGYSFQTTKDYGLYVGRMFAEKAKRRLTHSALETLAIIAFRQPISKPAIEAIRGVNADFVLKSLLEKDLVRIVGRDESVGRPLLYGTTDTFLKHFGLADLNDLPKPREIDELLEVEESIGIESIEESEDEEKLTSADVVAESAEFFDTVSIDHTPLMEESDESLEEVDLEKLQQAHANISIPLSVEMDENDFKKNEEEIIHEIERPTDKDDFEFEE